MSDLRVFTKRLEQAIMEVEQEPGKRAVRTGFLREILTFLKGLEPRKMSLDEVLASKSKPVYVICKERLDGYALVSGEVSGRVALTYPGTPEGKDCMLWPIKAGYGSFWECWTAPPRKAASSWEIPYSESFCMREGDRVIWNDKTYVVAENKGADRHGTGHIVLVAESEVNQDGRS